MAAILQTTYTSMYICVLFQILQKVAQRAQF